VSRFRPRNVVHNNERRGSGIDGQRALIRYARSSSGVGSWYVLERLVDKTTGMTNSTIDPVDCGALDPQIRVLWGGLRPRPAGWRWKDHRNGNNHSVVVRIDFGDASILWTGDVEEAEKPGGRAGIESLLDAYAGTDLLDVDVYQVGHHGSYNGTTTGLLAAMSPEIAVISAGPADCERKGYTAHSFGHPRESTVQALEAAVTGVRATPSSVRTYLGPGPSSPLNLRTVSKAVYSTGWDGTVVLTTTSDGTWSVESLAGTGPCIQ
jgi:competence protein ComEC